MSGTADGNQVQIFDCNGSAAQRWTARSGRERQGVRQVPGRPAQFERQRGSGAAVELQRHRRPAVVAAHGRLVAQPAVPSLPRPAEQQHRELDAVADLRLQRHRRAALDRPALITTPGRGRATGRPRPRIYRAAVAGGQYPEQSSWAGGAPGVVGALLGNRAPRPCCGASAAHVSVGSHLPELGEADVVAGRVPEPAVAAE